MELVSIIMSTYNENEDHLSKAIESILNQTYKNLEFIIVLDNPHAHNIKRIVFEFGKYDKRIIIIENEKNIGLPNSLNRALELCRGRFIARMDADDISFQDRIDVQLKYLIENKYDIIGSKFRKIDEIDEIIQSVSNTTCSAKAIKKILKYGSCVAHPTWLVRKEVFDNLKGYRNISTCEDYDFILRARRQKYKIGNCDSITLSYRLNTNGISRSNGLKQFLTTIYLQKNYRNLEHINQYDIEQYLKEKLTPQANAKFNRIQSCFSEVFSDKIGLISKISFLLWGFSSSKYFRVILNNAFKVKLIKLFAE